MSAADSSPAESSVVSSSVDASYQWCVRVAQSQAKNFYYSFLLLSAPRRRAMCAMYAFMRYCDDLSDDEGISDRPAAIAQWRRDLVSALAGDLPHHPLWPAFVHTVAKYRIPHHYFFEMIEGVSSDLEPRRTQTFDELYGYCYHVASVVGLTIIHIFGFDDSDAPAALVLAEKCGIAFQLTNILRDVREDAEKGRLYLPADDLERFGVSIVGSGPESPDRTMPRFEPADNFHDLMEFEAQRAREYYRESAPLIEMIDAQSRSSLRALIGIYSRLLDRIVAADFDVLSHRIRVPTWEKFWILIKSALPRFSSRRTAP
jgi:15-cis-phytoene synthase